MIKDNYQLRYLPLCERFNYIVLGKLVNIHMKKSYCL